MREVLRENIQLDCQVAAEAVLPAGSQSFNTPINFEEIAAALIQKMALKCAGTYGPSGLAGNNCVYPLGQLQMITPIVCFLY